jgi:hypothetical protein
MKIGFFRVSHQNENEQDLDSQIVHVCEKFNLDRDKITILQERESGYNLDRMQHRTEFLKLLDTCFNASNMTVKDLFLQKATNTKIELYVWDYHRLIRNVEFNLLFTLLCSMFEVQIYSYKDLPVRKKEDETPTEKMVRLIMNAVFAYSSEEYSYTISQNTRKAVVRNESGITTSRHGNKWGAQLRNTQGEIINLDEDSFNALRNEIYELTFKFGYAKIIEKIKQKYNVCISKSYITTVKQTYNKNI